MAGKQKRVTTKAFFQYQGLEFLEEDCLKKAKANFKKQYKGDDLSDIKIYIKPEEMKIYYVANEDKVGSVDL